MRAVGSFAYRVGLAGYHCVFYHAYHAAATVLVLISTTNVDYDRLSPTESV